jgi:hypothetical protein
MIVGVEAFRPMVASGTKPLAVSTTATSTVVFASAAALGDTRTIRIANAGGNTAWLEFGATTAVAATVTQSLPLASNSAIVLAVGPDALAVSGITATGTTSVYITPGYGGI